MGRSTMKMKAKLWTGFGILLALLLVLGGMSVTRLMMSDMTLRDVYDNRYKKLKHTSSLRTESYELTRMVSNTLLSGETENIGPVLGQIENLTQSVEKKLRQASALYTGEEESDSAAVMLESGTAYLLYIRQVKQHLEQGELEAAIELRASIGNRLQDSFHTQLTEVSLLQDREMDAAVDKSIEDNRSTLTGTAVLISLGLLLGGAVVYWIMVGMSRGIGILTSIATHYSSKREGRPKLPQTLSQDEFGQVARLFNKLAEDLERTADNALALNKTNANTLWLQSNVRDIYAQLQESKSVEELAEDFISAAATIVGASSGAFYVVQRRGVIEGKLTLAGAYALSDARAARELQLGQGLPGQAAKDGKKIRMETSAGEYGEIVSALGGLGASHISVYPVAYDGEVLAVFELVALRPYTELELQLMDQLTEVVGIMLHILQDRLHVAKMLRIHQSLTEELQSQSEELLSQQDELKASNERLEEQTKALRTSEEQLVRQQEELEHSNSQLMHKTAEVEEQMRETEEVNRQLELAKEALEKHALELTLASKYKTEFLANMSHELRTPLNSMLILSQLLKENKEGRLSDKQVEYAHTIYSSGCDLLKLIDDVLDLAKVEAGRMDLQHETVVLQELVAQLENAFTPIARSKGLRFVARVEEHLPHTIETDELRLQQVLKNLLSNAFKFTSSGSVSLSLRLIEQLPEQTSMLAIDVTDTGIGIPADKQQLIFEAFQQADGTTSRHYGGTGLGLSISRELASLLGGTIELESEVGYGSRFTLIVPLKRDTAMEEREASTGAGNASEALRQSAAAREGMHPTSRPASLLGVHSSVPSGMGSSPDAIEDDREAIAPGDRVLLIIEDDAYFASILLDMARSKGFKGIVALQGDTGLQLAKQSVPDAILLDIQLPVMDGWSVLTQLKNDPDTRHIPVHVISVVDEVQHGLALGAIAWLRKPASKERLEDAFAHVLSFLDKSLRSLLILHPNREYPTGLVEMIAHDDVAITAVSDSAEAIQMLRQQVYDCMVIDYGKGGLPLYELLDHIKADEALRSIPIIVYTGEELDKKEQLRLRKYAESIIIKDVRTPERLLDESALFLHRIAGQLPEEKRTILRRLHSIESIYTGKKVLLVDDDIRNVFALSSVLEGLGMQVVFAETGKQALAQLEREPDFSLVLMDIMMPEMDGYDAMRAIRADHRFERLPIIALTAKAMREDREKCLNAGASDYITKPIHTEQLLSLMRVWLSQ
ncbi:response regulator [Paenibacillus sp. YYML68]|uniref:response regulator n=1 Tax=Paenibacillus sp. YYML68 TaxID=2909250 RepID=UPI002490193A|nr:response regulator [Paenibacillus sp. YYML68]